MNSSKLSFFCDRALEAGWLLGVTITPVFFNVYSSRVFEPDKLTTLRSLALVMAVLWLVRLLEEVLRKKSPLRFSWRTPTVLPALATMVLYIASSALSLAPYTSFVGSYQRLQGTFSLFAYLVIFFALLTSLRTRAQLSRLITVLILNSLPVALYAIIQHNGLDPLPWAGDVQTRVAANMGNAIFVAAYLIMVVPLAVARIVESFRDILRRQESRMSDILRASGYIFIVAVQLLAIWYSQSRGPWLGIVAALFFFPYLMFILLQRQALSEGSEPSAWSSDLLKGIGVGVGALALALVLVGLGVLALPGRTGVYIGGGLALMAFGGVWLYFIVQRKGWRWLWIGWFTVGLIVLLAGLGMNVPGPLQDRVKQIPSLRRMTTILEWDTGTGRVRTLIWEGALDLISVHDPIAYPDGTADIFNAVRPVVGYGPESMYVAYNSFYPPLLGHYESRTASPDRSHNETLDSIVITGIVGLAAYLFVFGSVFYWGFHWLGLMQNRRQLWLYLGVSVAASAALFAFFVSQGYPYFFAVAIPLGFIAGAMLYLTWFAFKGLIQSPSESEAVPAMHPQALLLVAILAAVLGHFVEINFGIAIAATRTTFWALAALLVVLGLQWVPGETLSPESQATAESTQSSSRHRKQRARRARAAGHGWVAAVLMLSLVSGFLLSTLAFDFINNPDHLTDSGQIFWRSLTVLYSQQRTSYGALMILIFTGVLFGVVGLSEFDREGLFEGDRGSSILIAVLLYSGVTLFSLLIFGSAISGLHAGLPFIQPTTIEEVPEVAVRLSDVLGYYYALVFVMVVGISAAAFGESRRTQSLPWAEPVSLIVLPLLLLPGIWLIRNYNYDLIRADIVFKQGTTYANSADATQKQIGILHYERAIDYVPHEDQYYLFLGKVYLELTQSLPADVDVAEREALFLKTEQVLKEAQEINPLNTDHSANLARFYRSWASLSSDPERRAELLQLSEDSYRQAVTLSRHNPILWNELAILYAFDFNDAEAFEETILQSLDLDAEFETTWMILGDVRANIDQDIPEAVQAYQKALEIAPENCTVHQVVSSLQIQEGNWVDAADELETALDYCAATSNSWDLYRMLAVAYYYQGRTGEALGVADQALQLAPEDQQQVVEQLIAAIQQPVPVEQVPSEP